MALLQPGAFFWTRDTKGLVMWFYVPCIKSTNALVRTVVCWVLSTALSFPGSRRACQDVRCYFLMSFNSAHGGDVLLLAFLCGLHSFLTVLAVVAGLFSTPFLSLSVSLLSSRFMS